MFTIKCVCTPDCDHTITVEPSEMVRGGVFVSVRGNIPSVHLDAERLQELIDELVEALPLTE